MYKITVDVEVNAGSKVKLVPVTIIDNVPYIVALKVLESARKEFGYSKVCIGVI